MINRILEKILDIKSIDQVPILGIGDCNLKLVQSEIPVRITIRKEKLKIIGEKDDVNQAYQIFIEMIETLKSKGNLHKEDVRNLISMIKINIKWKHMWRKHHNPYIQTNTNSPPIFPIHFSLGTSRKVR